MDPTKLSPATLMEFVRKAMEMAESAIKSGDKAQYATNLVLLQITESNMTEEEKALCRAIVYTGILKNIFTLVIDGINGELNIKKINRKWRICCPSLCGKPEPEYDPPQVNPEIVLESAVEQQQPVSSLVQQVKSPFAVITQV